MGAGLQKQRRTGSVVCGNTAPASKPVDAHFQLQLSLLQEFHIFLSKPGDTSMKQQLYKFLKQANSSGVSNPEIKNIMSAFESFDFDQNILKSDGLFSEKYLESEVVDKIAFDVSRDCQSEHTEIRSLSPSAADGKGSGFNLPLKRKEDKSPVVVSPSPPPSTISSPPLPPPPPPTPCTPPPPPPPPFSQATSTWRTLSDSENDSPVAFRRNNSRRRHKTKTINWTGLTAKEIVGTMWEKKPDLPMDKIAAFFPEMEELFSIRDPNCDCKCCRPQLPPSSAPGFGNQGL